MKAERFTSGVVLLLPRGKLKRKCNSCSCQYRGRELKGFSPAMPHWAVVLYGPGFRCVRRRS